MSSAAHSFRFGVVGGAATVEEHIALARRAEDAGFDIYLSPDHLDLSGRHMARLAPIPALAAVAATTARIRVGTSVLNQAFRHPAVLAREVATLDVLSGGRFELGVGAGGMAYEHEWAGIPLDAFAERVDRLSEYLQVVTGILENASFSFAGRYFQITDMPGQPTPMQQPRPPLLVGGRSERVLELAARRADIVSIPLVFDPLEMDARIAFVKRAAGDRFESLELNTMVLGVVISDGDRRRAIARALDPSSGNSLAALAVFLGSDATPEKLADSPAVLAGSVEEIVDTLLKRRERWGDLPPGHFISRT